MVVASAAKQVAIIGGGPAGLIAAEVLSQHNIRVDLFDAMPSVGRKFLQAGKGGMNLTHSEAFEPFVNRYRQRQNEMRPLLQTFGADQLRQWAHDLGFDTFVGSSGRVFPDRYARRSPAADLVTAFTRSRGEISCPSSLDRLGSATAVSVRYPGK